jgi:hypothetical protein
VACDCHPIYAGSINRIVIQAGLGVNARTCLKVNRGKGADSVAQVAGVLSLANRHKALSSTPSTTHKKNNKRKETTNRN